MRRQAPRRGRGGTPARALLYARAGLRVLVAILLALPILGPLSPEFASALTSTTITIDGDFDDWAGVRADSDNTVVDSQLPTDPDWPGQADRDLYYVNYTYDEDYLYLAS